MQFYQSFTTLTCKKSMQLRGSIDKPVTFDIGLIQLIFHILVIILVCSPNTHACYKYKVFSIQIYIINISNISAKLCQVLFIIKNFRPHSV